MLKLICNNNKKKYKNCIFKGVKKYDIINYLIIILVIILIIYLTFLSKLANIYSYQARFL